MSAARVMAVFQGATGLAEDRFVNTFHFHDPEFAFLPEYIPDLHLMVGNFYKERYLTGSGVADYMSLFLGTTFTTHVYNLEDPVGEREPDIVTWDMPARSGGGLPEEVAVCLTLLGAPPITPRRRGRLYIGPLSNLSQVISNGDGALPSRVNISAPSSIGKQLNEAAGALITASALMPWCIRSVTPSENFVKVTSTYVDDAFDIQRRRGPDPSARIVMTPDDLLGT